MILVQNFYLEQRFKSLYRNEYVSYSGLAQFPEVEKENDKHSESYSETNDNIDEPHIEEDQCVVANFHHMNEPQKFSNELCDGTMNS